MTDSLHTSQQDLNEKFFAELDKQLLSDLRHDLEHADEAKALAVATGIVDTKVLDELVALHVTPETLAAFRMIPLLAVAWSDRKLDREERDILLDAASRRGMQPGSPSYRMLDEWMERPPAPQLMTAWLDYVEEICDSLSPTAISVLRSEVVGQAEMVAQAAGGIFGIGSVSKEEKDVLKTIRDAFPSN